MKYAVQVLFDDAWTYVVDSTGEAPILYDSKADAEASVTTTWKDADESSVRVVEYYPYADHTPHVWVVIRIKYNNETFYKVLGGWYGGYAGSDYWRLNSGISKVEKIGNIYYFYGSSGSCYACDADSYKLSLTTGGIYNQLKEKFEDAVELMPYSTDWLTLLTTDHLIEA